MPVIAGSSEFGTGWLRARFVASCTHDLNCTSSMHRSIVERSLAPACSAMALISSLVRPLVPSSGWLANISALKSKNESGEFSATHAAALAARSEYWVPDDLLVRIAIGCTSSVAAPSSTIVRIDSEFVASNCPQKGHR